MNILEVNSLQELLISEQLFDMDIYHTTEWVEINRDLQQGEELYILINGGANNYAFLPLIRRKIVGTDYYDVLSPYGYGGIVFSKKSTQKFKEKAFEELYEYLKKKGCISLFLRLHPILNKDIVSKDIFLNGSTLVIILNDDYYTLYNKYSSGHKYDIKKSFKNPDIKVVDDIDFLYFESFISIYHETMDYLQASSFYFFNESYFKKLKEKLNSKLKLIVVLEGDKVIGASLFILYNQIIQYHLSGTTYQGRIHQPSKLILDYMIRWGIEHQYKYLHLGGGVGGQKDSLYKFKKGFASEEIEFSTLRKVINKEVYTHLCLKQGYILDEIEDISQFFPLYRKSQIMG